MKRSDPQFGNLTYNLDIGWWEGYVKLESGLSFEVFVHTPDKSDPAITDHARAAFETMKSSELYARQFAAKELLSTHNNSWNEGDPISAEEFIKRLIPTTIQVWPDGDAEISFADDDMFWGHEVGVRYRGGKFSEAVVQG